MEPVVSVSIRKPDKFKTPGKEKFITGKLKTMKNLQDYSWYQTKNHNLNQTATIISF